MGEINLRVTLDDAYELYCDKTSFSQVKEKDVDWSTKSKKSLTIAQHAQIIRNAMKTCRRETDKKDLLGVVKPLTNQLPSGWIDTIVDIARNYLSGNGLQSSRSMIEQALNTPFEEQPLKPIPQKAQSGNDVQSFLIDHKDDLGKIHWGAAASRGIRWNLFVLSERAATREQQQRALDFLKTQPLNEVKRELEDLTRHD